MRARRRSRCSVSPSAQWRSSATSSSGCSRLEPAEQLRPPRSGAGSGRRLGSPAAAAAPVSRSSSGTSRASTSPRVAEALRERVGIADAQQELEPLPQRLVRRADRGVGGAVEHEHAARRRLVRELAHEPRLAAAGLGREQHEAALAALGPLEQRAQRRQLARAADERERRRRHERARAATTGPAEQPRSARGSSAASWVRICRSSCRSAAPGSSPSSSSAARASR